MGAPPWHTPALPKSLVCKAICQNGWSSHGRFFIENHPVAPPLSDQTPSDNGVCERADVFFSSKYGYACRLHSVDTIYRKKAGSACRLICPAGPKGTRGITTREPPVWQRYALNVAHGAPWIDLPLTMEARKNILQELWLARLRHYDDTTQSSCGWV